MNTLEYVGPERRNYVRIIYKPSMRAKLNIGSEEFEVLDINESGIRFSNPSGSKIPGFIHSKLSLLNGDTIDVDGKIEWERETEVGISLNFRIPSKDIEKEQRYIILNCD